jgi:argonaute-like protein implicated in RNA metabolism and viral defense
MSNLEFVKEFDEIALFNEEYSIQGIFYKTDLSSPSSIASPECISIIK